MNVIPNFPALAGKLSWISHFLSHKQKYFINLNKTYFYLHEIIFILQGFFLISFNWIMDSCKCCKKEEDGMGGGMGVNSKIWLRFFIYTTKKNLPYRTELSVGLECVKKSLKNFHTIHAFSYSFAFFLWQSNKVVLLQ